MRHALGDDSHFIISCQMMPLVKRDAATYAVKRARSADNAYLEAR